MIRFKENHASSRRHFLSQCFSGGTLLCLGSYHLFAVTESRNRQKAGASQHKFLDDSGMSFKEVYEFAFSGNFVPVMQNLANEIGKSEFIPLLKEASAKSAVAYMRKQTESLPSLDFPAFKSFFKSEDRFWRHVLTKEVVEETDKAIEVRISECLWAETFRSADASDIGYAAICYPDFAMYSAFNPHIKLIRTKTLMEGHDCCNHRCEWIE